MIHNKLYLDENGDKKVLIPAYAFFASYMCLLLGAAIKTFFLEDTARRCCSYKGIVSHIF
jgi:hypothetical protein